MLHRPADPQTVSVTVVQYRDELLDLTVRLWAAAVGSIFVLMNGDVRPQRAVIFGDYLKRKERDAVLSYSVLIRL